MMRDVATIRAGAALLMIGALLLVSCLQRPYRLRYLSFEKVDGITVNSTARIDLENLMFASEIPVEYTLQRPGYAVSVRIERQSFRPRATIALRGERNLRIVARPRLTMRPGRVAPCGGYDQISSEGQKLLFSWSICGDDAAPEEFQLAFDVVDASGAIVRGERLPFELKKDGIFWANDSL